MNFDALRQKIIDKAIRGELVPQLESEPEVTLDHVVKTDSPFPIPKKWQWASLGDVATLISGRDLPINEISDSNLTTPYITGASQISRGKILINRWTENPTVISEINDVLITCKGTVGNLAVNKFGRLHIARQIMAIRPGEMLSAEYLLIYLKYIRQDLTKEASGLIPGITRDVMLSKIIAIPPIREQARIVSYLNNLLRKINVIEQSYSILNILSSVLEKKVLQTAIEGNLVPQLESEPEVISYSEQPQQVDFQIPKKWKWIKLDQVASIVRGGSPRPIKAYITDSADGINWIKIGDAERGSVRIQHCSEKIKPEGMKKSRFVRKGSLLLTNSMSYGFPYILDVDGCIHDGWLAFSDFEQYVERDYLYYVLLSPYCKRMFSAKAAGAVVKNLNIDKVKSLWIPVPPHQEQKRIVKKLTAMAEVFRQISNCNQEG